MGLDDTGRVKRYQQSNHLQRPDGYHFDRQDIARRKCARL
jgi:hypothetical protein